MPALFRFRLPALPGRPRRLALLTCCLLLLGLGVAAVAPAASAASANLLSNGDFATGSTSGWTCSSGDTVVTSPTYDGSAYALAGTPTDSDYARCSQVVSVQPSSSYSLSGWVEGDYVYLGDSGTGGTDTSDWTPSAATWTELSTSFTTGSATTSVTIYVNGWYAQPEFYADDLTLTGAAGSGGGGGGGGDDGARPRPRTWRSPAPRPRRSRSPGRRRQAPSPATTCRRTAARWRPSPARPTPSPVWPPRPPIRSPSAPTTPRASRRPLTGQRDHGRQLRRRSGGGSGGLPAHVLMGYWQDFANGATPLTLADVPTSYNLVAVAFGAATGTPGQVSFSLDPTLASDLGGYTQQQFINDIATLQARGQKVILSVGGADGAISVDDAASASAFASSVYSLIQQYGFNGVDVDLENGVDPTYMASALEQLESDVGSSLIITLAPQTVDTQSTGDDYFQLALDIKSILTMINTQYYNSGTMNGCDGNVYAEGTENFITALACTELEGGLSPSQVGVGLPASTAAAGSGYVTPSVVDDALDCLASGANCGSFVPPQTWPGIRGAMTWSINWDAANGYNFADTVSPYLSTLP